MPKTDREAQIMDLYRAKLRESDTLNPVLYVGQCRNCHIDLPTRGTLNGFCSSSCKHRWEHRNL